MSIQPAFLVKPCSNLEHVHRNTWKILTRKAVSFELLMNLNILCQIIYVSFFSTFIKWWKDFQTQVMANTEAQAILLVLLFLDNFLPPTNPPYSDNKSL